MIFKGVKIMSTRRQYTGNQTQLIESGGELFDRGHKPSDERIVFENEQLLKK
jgi:hypothetical protein